MYYIHTYILWKIDIKKREALQVNAVLWNEYLIKAETYGKLIFVEGRNY